MATHERLDPKLVCLDIDGTLTDGIGGPAIEGAIKAVHRIGQRRPIRYVTNASSLSRRAMAARLTEAGFPDANARLVTPLDGAREILTSRGQARGILFCYDAAREDLTWFHEDPSGPTVLIASEGHHLTLGDLQPAFRVLLDGGDLYSLTRNRYFRHEGQLVTDLGPIAAFLSYASGREPQILGKPSPLLFDAIAQSAGVARADLVMVGDDAEFDASGSVAIGMAGVLVRTGKYRPSDEDAHQPRPTAVVDSVADLPELLRSRPAR